MCFFLPDQVFEASGGSWTLRVTREAPAVLPGLRVMSRNRYDRSHLASRYSQGTLGHKIIVANQHKLMQINRNQRKTKEIYENLMKYQ